MLTVLWQSKSTVSFPLEDKHVVNEYHVMRKSHDVTQKKCPHVVHLNVPRDWFETNSRHQKRYSEGGKKNRGCRGLLGRVISIVVPGFKTTNSTLSSLDSVFSNLLALELFNFIVF